MKRISINKYINSLYKYYCEKADIEYKDLINNKNNFKINKNILKIIDEIYEKYKYIEKNEDDYILSLKYFVKYWNIFEKLT